jgi:hypothetical protein
LERMSTREPRLTLGPVTDGAEVGRVWHMPGMAPDGRRWYCNQMGGEKVL